MIEAMVSTFGSFGLKMPIQAPKVGIFGEFDPLNGSSINKTHKRHILVRVRVI